MARTIEQFTRKSPAQRLLAGGVLAVSLGLVAAAERDIQRRPAEQVRGSKPLWRFVCLNAFGAIGYLSWDAARQGRKERGRSTHGACRTTWS